MLCHHLGCSRIAEFFTLPLIGYPPKTKPSFWCNEHVPEKDDDGDAIKRWRIHFDAISDFARKGDQEFVYRAIRRAIGI